MTSHNGALYTVAPKYNFCSPHHFFCSPHHFFCSPQPFFCSPHPFFCSLHPFFCSPHHLFSSPHHLFSSLYPSTNCSLLRTLTSEVRVRRREKMVAEKRKNGCGEEKKWVRRREIVLWGHCSYIPSGLGLECEATV